MSTSKTFFGSIAASIMIAIGGTVYLSCDNKYIGSILFAVALLVICFKGYNLFTGKIGYLVTKHHALDIEELGITLLGNCSVYLIGFITSYILPQVHTKAVDICTVKISMPAYIILFKAIMCGVLMYVAIDIFKKCKSPIGIIYCIPVFILSGYEHSIADMFYLGVARDISLIGLITVMLVILGNAIGSCIIAWLESKA